MRKVIKILYNLAAWTFMLAEGCILMVIALVIFPVAYPFDPKRKAEHYLSVYWALHYFWFNPFWKIKYTCEAEIDRKQPYIIVCNHQSMLDIFLMYKVPLIFKWVSKAEVLRMPFVGLMLKLHGDILIKRGEKQSVKYLIKQSAVWLEKGCCVSIFPEGTRSQDGRIQEFKEGAFSVAKLNKVPILPVVVEGTARMMPPHSLFLGGCATAQIKVLPVISAETVASMKTRDLSAMLHEMMLAEHKKMAPGRYDE